MKTIMKFLTMLAFVAVLFSCKKDDDNNSSNLPGFYDAKYEVKSGGEIVESGTLPAMASISNGVSSITILKESEDNGDIEFGITIAGYSETIGQTTEVNGVDTGVSVLRKPPLMSKSGTIKRDSETKVSFSAIGTDGKEFTGYISSEAYKHPITD